MKSTEEIINDMTEYFKKVSEEGIDGADSLFVHLFPYPVLHVCFYKDGEAKCAYRMDFECGTTEALYERD